MSGRFCPLHMGSFHTSSPRMIVRSRGQCLPAEPGTSAGPATDTVPGAAGAGAAAAGCSTAAGPAGSSHLHFADHTEVGSVGRAKESKHMSGSRRT